MKADLHCHTSCSDGSTTPETLISYASQMGINVVAITDHDTMMGFSQSLLQCGSRLGVQVVPGVELSAMDLRRGIKVHVLCYLPSRPGKLEALCQKVLKSRDKSFRESLRKVQERFPVSKEQVLTYAKESACLYQVHIMRALMEMGYTDKIYGALYQELLGDEGSCKVPHSYLDMWEAADCVKSAGGVCVMAHPSVYHSIESMKELAAKGVLDGIEIDHPRNSPEDRQVIAETIHKYDLIPTGGTDFHGAYSSLPCPLGTGTTGEDALKRIFDAAKARQS